MPRNHGMIIFQYCIENEFCIHIHIILCSTTIYTRLSFIRRSLLVFGLWGSLIHAFRCLSQIESLITRSSANRRWRHECEPLAGEVNHGFWPLRTPLLPLSGCWSATKSILAMVLWLCVHGWMYGVWLDLWAQYITPAAWHWVLASTWVSMHGTRALLSDSELLNYKSIMWQHPSVYSNVVHQFFCLFTFIDHCIV